LKPVAEPAAVETYEAERIPGVELAVARGKNPISEAAAVLRLKAGKDIVVCGSDLKKSRSKAQELTIRAFQGAERNPPHGDKALPHYHPPGHVPEVHAFYETPHRHARKSKA
jgi:hypothetical protein